ncbi:hypothetical protein LCGC14_1985010 [marine sediment metagenome]|uniref:Uncharacterized protein n=1 Tax=marine sediment metagenome TaxID=412755 RepID=A0A0F9FVU5_9ZZZZ
MKCLRCGCVDVKMFDKGEPYHCTACLRYIERLLQLQYEVTAIHLFENEED